MTIDHRRPVHADRQQAPDAGARPPAGPATRRATSADIVPVSRALAEGFQDDPVFSWLLPDDDARRARLDPLFTVFTRAYVPHGETYTTDGGGGAALWAPPDRDPLAGPEAEMFGDELRTIFGDAVLRSAELQALLEACHPTESCFYLQFMGVLPTHQRQGIGSALLSHVLSRCDADATPAYLEATSVHNRRLYERHGFATVEQLTITGGPTLWAMWREPTRTR